MKEVISILFNPMNTTFRQGMVPDLQGIEMCKMLSVLRTYELLELKYTLQVK